MPWRTRGDTLEFAKTQRKGKDLSREGTSFAFDTSGDQPAHATRQERTCESVSRSKASSVLSQRTASTWGAIQSGCTGRDLSLLKKKTSFNADELSAGQREEVSMLVEREAEASSLSPKIEKHVKMTKKAFSPSEKTNCTSGDEPRTREKTGKHGERGTH